MDSVAESLNILRNEEWISDAMVTALIEFYDNLCKVFEFLGPPDMAPSTDGRIQFVWDERNSIENYLEITATLEHTGLTFEVFATDAKNRWAEDYSSQHDMMCDITFANWVNLFKE